MQTEKETRKILLNSKVGDSGGKIIFNDNVLCSQFLRDYVHLPCLKDIKPEDIEDVSEQFVPLFEEERNADRVKRVNINSKNPFFLISLIEHKTEVDYNIVMQVFRYMVFIWEAYEKEMEKQQKGISRLAGFQYPPIIPIVYYEGKKNWTAPLNFKSRIVHGDQFGKYVPDFTYYLVPLKEYSNEALVEQGDEISLIMLINKLQSKEDVEEFRKLPAEKLDAMLKDTPGYIRNIIADVMMAFLLKENVPVSEARELAGKVKEKKMAQLFEHMEKMDIQAERRKTEEQRKRTEEQRRIAEEQRRVAEEQRRIAEEQRKKVEQSIKILIETCREFNAVKEDTVLRIMGNYDLDREQAEEKVNLYWK